LRNSPTTRLAEKIAKDVMNVFNYGEESVSVAFEEISSHDWKKKVYPARHSGKVGPALQETRIRDVKSERRKGRMKQ